MRFILFFVLSIAVRFSWAIPVFINEIHYDNIGIDSGEAVEIAGPAGTDLAGWQISFYNGSNGVVYGTLGLSGVIVNLSNGFGTLAFDFAGFQNGAPDGLALIDDLNQVIQFLSYEGVMTALSGPATGLLSQDIGVQESSTTPAGASLALTGSGSRYQDFIWAVSGTESFGKINADQNFVTVPVAPGIVLLATGLALLAQRKGRRPPASALFNARGRKISCWHAIPD